MVALAKQKIEQFLRKPDFSRPIILLYGSDSGLAHERAAFLAKQAGDTVAGDGGVTKLDAADLKDDPHIISNLSRMVPLFGGQQIIWLRAVSGANLLPVITTQLEDAGNTSCLIIEAGELRKSSKIRSAVEHHARAIAISCFADNISDLERLVDEVLGQAGMKIEKDARSLLISLLGSDRLASRGELDKLVLYAHGQSNIGYKDVQAVVGDVAAANLERLSDHIALGEIRALDIILQRLQATGTRADQIGTAALRHFQFLHKARYQLNQGISREAIFNASRPPIFFFRREKISRQIDLWSMENLERALERLSRAQFETRNMPILANAIIGETLLACAGAAAARLSARRPI